jgi:hypothetical protein
MAAAIRFGLELEELSDEGEIPMPEEEEPEPWVVPLGEAWQLISRWKLLWKGTWQQYEHINIQELRTASLLARHLARARGCWGKMYILFVDNLVALARVRRMRGMSPPLLRPLRRIGAIQLCTGIRLILRWVPTHLNWSDGPSHGEAVGLAKQNEPGARDGPGRLARAGGLG